MRFNIGNEYIICLHVQIEDNEDMINIGRFITENCWILCTSSEIEKADYKVTLATSRKSNEIDQDTQLLKETNQAKDFWATLMNKIDECLDMCYNQQFNYNSILIPMSFSSFTNPYGLLSINIIFTIFSSFYSLNTPSRRSFKICQVICI